MKKKSKKKTLSTQKTKSSAANNLQLIDQGIAHHQAGRLTEAEAIYRKILQENPKHDSALHLLGVIAYQVGKPQQAIELIQQAIAVNPNFADFYSNLGNAYKANNEWEKAIAAYKQAIQRNPQHAQAYGNLGNVYKEQGEDEQAIICYQKVLQWLPNNPIAYNNLGNIYKNQAFYDRAIEYYQKAITVQPTYADAYHNLSLVFVKQEKWAEALTAGQKAAELNPKSVNALLNLADIYAQQEKPGVALDYLKQALALEPKNELVYFHFGKFLHEQEKYDEAIEAYHHALQLKSDYPEVYSNIGSIYKERAQYLIAKQYFEKSLAIKPEVAEVHSNLASVLLELGQLELAKQHYEKGLALKPEYANLYNNISVLLRTMGEVDSALYYCEQGLKLQPDFADIHLSAAFSNLIVGRFAAGWEKYIWRHNRINSHLKETLSPVEFLPLQLQGKRFLLHKDQGLGDELFFLRFVQVLKARGPWLAYRAGKKIASIIQRQPWLDQLIDQHADTFPEVDYTVMIGDLPYMLGMKYSAQIPPPLPLTVLPEKIAPVHTRLTAAGKPPYIGLTWQAGVKLEERGKQKILAKAIPLEHLAAGLQPIQATFVVLQRNPDPQAMATLQQLLGQPVHDFSDLNEDLESMLVLLALLDDYVGVSNTNMHLLAGLGKTAKVLIPSPPDWRWMLEGEESPWFKGFRIYRQTKYLDWGPAIHQLQQDLIDQYRGGKDFSSQIRPLLAQAKQHAQQRNFAEAEQLYRQVLQWQPTHIEACGNLGNLYHRQEKNGEAIICYEKVLSWHPNHLIALNNLGNVYNDIGDFDLAIQYYQSVLEIKPDFAEVHSNLGTIYRELQQYDKAIACYQKALQIKPDIAETHQNISVALSSQGQIEAALKYSEQAIVINPAYPGGHYGKAANSLTLGNFSAETWYHYAWRKARVEFKHPLSELKPLPEVLQGQRFLLHKDQGLGDELFFMRFIPQLKAKGAWIAYRPGNKISPIVQRQPWLDQWIEEFAPHFPNLDFQYLVGDLPQLLQVQTAADLPPPLPLTALTERVDELQRILTELGPPPYFGITWEGGQFQVGRTTKLYKAIPLTTLANALKPFKATYLILQRNPKPGEIEQFSEELGQPAHDLTRFNEDLEGMLALLTLIDEYIGVSNTNMHLLASIGKTAHVLVPFPAEWRWLASGEVSPWFPGFKIYRQNIDKDWSGALIKLQNFLKNN